jgi:MFS family permease
LAALLLPLVELAPDAWRALFVIGLVPLLWLPGWRRTLPETERFEAHRASAPVEFVATPALAPMLALVRAYPGRFAALSAVVFTLSAAGAAADFFSVKYLQHAHGWEPRQVTLLVLLGGVLAIAASAQAGRLSDRIGRRPAATIFAAGVILFAIGFYNGAGAWLPPLWIALIVFLLADEVMIATYGSELFPTSQRATAAGARALVATVGGVLGLALESPLYALLGSHWQAISLLLLFGLLAPFVIAATFPETAGRSLEDIAPEPVRPAPSLPLPTARPEETS